MSFSKTLTDWYLQHKRDLPWRNTDNPYLIWLSEIMLQQTRVAQGLPYFLTFVEHFPTVFDLANAEEEKVLRLWQGLGYYSRARNLHKTAQYIASEQSGRFPDTYDDLLKLKGIGEYTAAAIASFSYNEAVPVVDGNVFRVLARYFDIETDIASASAKKEFTALAHELIPKDNAATFNQAIMEFGALQCVPKNPDCEVCPFNGSCLALKYGKVDALPVKSKKAKARNRYFTYLVFEDEIGRTRIAKRTGKGIWRNLYEFPLIETENDSVISEPSAFIAEGDEFISISTLESSTMTHKLSHQHLTIRFVKIRLKGTIPDGVAIDELHTFPFPVALYNFIRSHWK